MLPHSKNHLTHIFAMLNTIPITEFSRNQTFTNSEELRHFLTKLSDCGKGYKIIEVMHSE